MEESSPACTVKFGKIEITDIEDFSMKYSQDTLTIKNNEEVIEFKKINNQIIIFFSYCDINYCIYLDDFLNNHIFLEDYTTFEKYFSINKVYIGYDIQTILLESIAEAKNKTSLSDLEKSLLEIAHEFSQASFSEYFNRHYEIIIKIFINKLPNYFNLIYNNKNISEYLKDDLMLNKDKIINIIQAQQKEIEKDTYQGILEQNGKNYIIIPSSFLYIDILYTLSKLHHLST